MQVFWTKADNAMGYIIVGINVANSRVDGDPACRSNETTGNDDNREHFRPDSREQDL